MKRGHSCRCPEILAIDEDGKCCGCGFRVSERLKQLWFEVKGAREERDRCREAADGQARRAIALELDLRDCRKEML